MAARKRGKTIRGAVKGKALGRLRGAARPGRGKTNVATTTGVEKRSRKGVTYKVSPGGTVTMYKGGKKQQSARAQGLGRNE